MNKSEIKKMLKDMQSGFVFIGAFSTYNEMRRQAEKKLGNYAVAGKHGRTYVYDGRRWTFIAPFSMPKIMFSERYGLQQAVLSCYKTMTRRLVKCPKRFKGAEDVQLEFHKRPGQDFYYDCVVVDGNEHELGQLHLPYKIGQILAIAQSYESLFNECTLPTTKMTLEILRDTAGWRNKMFVRSEHMSHHIRITDLWFERLQDISDEDCMKEGVEKWLDCYIVPGIMEKSGKNNVCFDTPREAFAELINRISGKGTWEKNPWVVAYTFELLI